MYELVTKCFPSNQWDLLWISCWAPYSHCFISSRQTSFVLCSNTIIIHRDYHEDGPPYKHNAPKSLPSPRSRCYTRVCRPEEDQIHTCCRQQLALSIPLASPTPRLPPDRLLTRSYARLFPNIFRQSGNFSSGPGGYFIIRPDFLHGWSSREPEQELIALLETEDEILYRDTSSAVFDAALFPSLPSTPFWVRLLYFLLAFSPATQRQMINKLLWIQVQMMYFAHDFRMYHGSFGFLYLWLLTHPFRSERPPNWVYTIEWWSVSLRSTAMHSICYWFGRLFLGMKAEYLEYTPGNGAATRHNDKVTSHI
jgi:hypothetical protein